MKKLLLLALLPIFAITFNASAESNRSTRLGGQGLKFTLEMENLKVIGPEEDRGTYVYIPFISGIEQKNDAVLNDYSFDKSYCWLSVYYGNNAYRHLIKTDEYPEFFLDKGTLLLEEVSGWVESGNKPGEWDVRQITFAVNPSVDNMGVKVPSGIKLSRVDGKPSNTIISSITCRGLDLRVSDLFRSFTTALRSVSDSNAP